ncbi:hypothetical protein ACOCJ4_03830 [Knoellia sp. CPCC 206435]|uniref:hypothetical protein n=1 Tax=Knoellia terrae TaxID=3404797 RepID=UPI003B43D0A2
MSQPSYPPHPGPPPHPYAGHPAYGFPPPPPAPQPGLNPWVAGVIGALVGGVLTVVATTLLPMIFFGLMMGAGGFMDEGFMGPERGQVAVTADGSVSGVVLADDLEDAPWYEDVTCPDTTAVGTDVTTICSGNDGVDDLRIVVVFRGTEGEYGTADLWE